MCKFFILKADDLFLTKSGEKMTEEELLKIYEDIYLYLYRKSIHELRSYGRAFCVKSPSSYKKHDLIMCIIRIGSGEESAPARSIRGARPKMQEVAAEDIKRLKNMFLGEENPNEQEKNDLSVSGVEAQNLAEDCVQTSAEQNNSPKFSLSDMKDGIYQVRGILKIEGKSICIKLESAE